MKPESKSRSLDRGGGERRQLLLAVVGCVARTGVQRRWERTRTGIETLLFNQSGRFYR